MIKGKDVSHIKKYKDLCEYKLNQWVKQMDPVHYQSKISDVKTKSCFHYPIYQIIIVTQYEERDIKSQKVNLKFSKEDLTDSAINPKEIDRINPWSYKIPEKFIGEDPLHVTLPKTYHQMICTRCKGLKEEQCPVCKGKMQIPCSSCSLSEQVLYKKSGNKNNNLPCDICKDKRFVICKNCDGKGKIPCDLCKGIGKTNHALQIVQTFKKNEKSIFLVSDYIKKQLPNFSPKKYLKAHVGNLIFEKTYQSHLKIDHLMMHLPSVILEDPESRHEILQMAKSIKPASTERNDIRYKVIVKQLDAFYMEYEYQSKIRYLLYYEGDDRFYYLSNPFEKQVQGWMSEVQDRQLALYGASTAIVLMNFIRLWTLSNFADAILWLIIPVLMSLLYAKLTPIHLLLSFREIGKLALVVSSMILFIIIYFVLLFGYHFIKI